MNVYLIGIAGGSGSGKTTFARLLNEHFNEHSDILYQDNYYKDQSHRFDHDGGAVNFDHPDSIDFELLYKHTKELKKNNPIDLPYYDFATHKRLKKTSKFEPKKVIFIDGILLFSQPNLLDIFDHKIYTDCDETTRFERRLKRDIEERGRTKDGVITQFKNQVKPMHDQFVEPSKEHACDIIHQENFDDKLAQWKQKIATLIL